MFHHRSQTPLSNSHASSLQSSSARDHTECQEIRKVQMAPPASTFPTALPRIPASVKLPAQTNQSLEFLQPSRSKQVNGPSKERWEERPRQSSLDYDNEKGGGSSDLRHDSLRSHSEKSYGEQSHRDFARHSPSRRHHTTIDFEPDDMEDESIVETHSVWILVSRCLLVHPVTQADGTWCVNLGFTHLTSQDAMRNHQISNQRREVTLHRGIRDSFPQFQRRQDTNNIYPRSTSPASQPSSPPSFPSTPSSQSPSSSLSIPSPSSASNADPSATKSAISSSRPSPSSSTYSTPKSASTSMPIQIPSCSFS